MMEESPQQPDPWMKLRSYTSARIGLGRSGVSIPSRALLNFKMDHAHARDAVYSSLEIPALESGLAALGQQFCVVQSQVSSRTEYLQRPDLGRKLCENSWQTLAGRKVAHEPALTIIVADGLSATAINRHALPLLRELLRLIDNSLTLTPIIIVEQGRVAISDEIGALMGATIALILVGERPGLTSPDSMGAYLTYGPKIGNTDELRNCVSNIRPEGLTCRLAAARIFYLMQESLTRKLSGIKLKDHGGYLT